MRVRAHHVASAFVSPCRRDTEICLKKNSKKYESDRTPTPTLHHAFHAFGGVVPYKDCRPQCPCSDTGRDSRPQTGEQERAMGIGRRLTLLRLSTLLLGAAIADGAATSADRRRCAYDHLRSALLACIGLTVTSSSLPGTTVLSPLFIPNIRIILRWNGPPEDYKFDLFADSEHPPPRDARHPLRLHAVIESQAGRLLRWGGVAGQPLLRLRGAGYGVDDEEAVRRRELESLREVLQQSKETLERALAREEEDLEEQEEQTRIRDEREQRRRERAGETAFLRSVAIRDAERDGMPAHAGTSSAPPAPSTDLSRGVTSLPRQRHDGSAAAGSLPRRDHGAGAFGGHMRPSRWESLRIEEGISAGDEASVVESFQDSDMVDMGSSISARAHIILTNALNSAFTSKNVLGH